MTIGEKILKLRKARGWNQEELADRIGVTRQAVSRWESDSAKPDADKIVAICDLFGVSADYLLREDYIGSTEMQGTSFPKNENHHEFSAGILILGAVISCIGAIAFLVLIALSDMKPHWYHIGSKVYKGLAGFLLGNDLVWLMVVVGIMVVLGVVLLLWGGILNSFLKRKSQ